MARQNVAEQFVDILVRAGVKRLYGVVGDSLNPIVDATRRNSGIDWIQVRHEESGAFAAGAEGRRRIIGSFTHGSMANALPQAIGAQFTNRKRQVVAMSGDGGFSMLMGDFLTLVQYGLPVKAVLFNNSSLGMVELEMMVAGLPAYGTTNRNPDFARVAEAAGAYGVRVENPKQLPGALQDAFRHKGPALVDVVTDPNALSIPPKIKAEMLTGFALSTSKMVLGGGVGRMLQMARSNLRNLPRP